MCVVSYHTSTSALSRTYCAYTSCRPLLLLLRAARPTQNAGRERISCALPRLVGSAIGVRCLWSYRCSATCCGTLTQAPHTDISENSNNNKHHIAHQHAPTSCYITLPPRPPIDSYNIRFKSCTYIICDLILKPLQNPSHLPPTPHPPPFFFRSVMLKRPT